VGDEFDGRFWYKRLITKLDKVTLNNIFKADEIDDEEDTNFDFELNKEVKSRNKKVTSYITKDNNDTDHGNSEEVGSAGKDWQKLMNLLMQLRKICNQ